MPAEKAQSLEEEACVKIKTQLAETIKKICRREYYAVAPCSHDEEDGCCLQHS